MKPLITIWYKPSETFDHLLGIYRYDSKYLWIFYVVALITAIPSILKSDFQTLLGPLFLVLIIILTSVLGGLLFQFLWVFIFWISGKILQGNAKSEEIRIVFGYSMLPFTFKIIPLMIGLINFNVDKSKYSQIGIYNYLTDAILFLLFLRFFVIGLSKVQKFSYRYALINFFLPVSILGLLLYLIKY